MLPGNERIHHNGEDYVPAYWLTIGKDALNQALAELATLTEALAAERARSAALTEALEWIRDECEMVNRANHNELAWAVIKSADFARFGLDSHRAARQPTREE